MGELLRARALEKPESTAFAFLEDASDLEIAVTYRELLERSETTALFLLERLAPGSRVLIALPSGLEYLTVFYACQLAGLAAVTVFPPSQQENMRLRLENITLDCEPSLIVTTSRGLKMLARSPEGSPLASLPGVTPEDFVNAKSLDRGYLLQNQTSDSLSFLQYTSGSTSTPRGVMISQGNVLSNLENLHRTILEPDESELVSWLPLFHDMGLIGCALYALYAGVPNRFMSPFAFLQDPFRWLRAVSGRKNVVSAAPNFAFDYCSEAAEQGADLTSLDLSGWRQINLGSEPIRAESLRRFAETFAPAGFNQSAFNPCYGLAEATLIVTGGRSRSGALARHFDRSALKNDQAQEGEAGAGGVTLTSCGPVMEDSQVRITDPETGEDLEPGVVGEILVSGPGVARGYWGRQEESRKTFMDDGAGGIYLRTGDKGFLWEGELFVAGRLKDMLILAGENYYAEDLERTVEPVHEDFLAGACAIFAQDVQGVETPIVLQEIGRETSADLKQISRDVYGALLEKHQIQIHALILVPQGALPRTTSGKIRRSEARLYREEKKLEILAEFQYAEGSSPEADGNFSERLSVLPEGERVTVLLAKLIETLAFTLHLSPEEIKPERRFLELGLSSLVAVKLQRGVQNLLGFAPSFADIFGEQTVEGLAGLLVERFNAGQGGDLLRVPLPEADLKNLYEPFPLTEIQQAYWIGRQGLMELGDVGIHGYFELEGENLDVPRLEKAWNQLIQRHPNLRVIALNESEQRFLRPEEIEIYTFARPDLSQNLQAVTLRERMSHKVYDPEIWPMFEIQAGRLSDTRTRLFISIDCMNLDVGSLVLLFEQWRALYENPEIEFPALAYSYRDYALALKELEHTDLYKKSLAFWDTRLVDMPAAPELPQVSGTELDATAFRRREYRMSGEQTRLLEEKARKHGLTLSGTLLAVYAEVLANWSRSPGFTLNVTLFNRLDVHEQVNHLAGDFTSMLPLGVNVAGAPEFAGRAGLIQKELFECFDNRIVSGVRVLRELARNRGRSGAALPIVFTSTLGILEGAALTPLHGYLEEVYTLSQTPQVSLDYQVHDLDREGGVLHVWDAVEELFPPGVLDQMFQAFCSLIEVLTANENPWLESRFTFLPEAQREARREVNATDSLVPEELPHEAFARQAHRRPDAPAVIWPDGQMTYAELEAASNRLGRALREAGAKPDARVAVVMEKGPEQIVAVFGVLKSGAAYLPVDANVPSERIRRLVEQGECFAVLTQSKFIENLGELLEAPVFTVETTGPEGYSDEALQSIQSPEDLAYILYTSGSTGEPRGVMIENRSVANRMSEVVSRYGIVETDRAFALTALHHDLSVFDLFGVLSFAGGALVLPAAESLKDPSHWPDLMGEGQVTLWNSVPTFMGMLLEYLESRPDGARGIQLRWSIFSGEFIPLELPTRLRKLLPQIEIIASGGPTETTVWDISYPLGVMDETWKSIPYGRPMNNARYYVLDEFLRERPDYVTGEFYIAGEGLARGYWKNEEETAKRFLTHPASGERLYKSGDLGYWAPDGTLRIQGRVDAQLKMRGMRIEPGEIESVLRNIPGVQSAAVKAIGEEGRRILAAYIVPLEKGESQEDLDPYRSFEGVELTDPAERVAFKMEEKGLRNIQGDGNFSLELDEPAPEEFLKRRSFRSFQEGPLALESFKAVLSALNQHRFEEMPTPKYEYGSAGGLYPVQTYLHVKTGRVAGLEGGFYYHDARNRRLVLLASGEIPDSRAVFAPVNRGLFEESAFTIFLTGRMSAIRPMYGDLAQNFCLLEAGMISQLLESVGPERGVGFCSMGGVRLDSLRRLLGLEEDDIFLHALAGGGVFPGALSESALREDALKDGKPPLLDGLSSLERSIKKEMARMLPDYMLPSVYVTLDEMPLNSGGKPDRANLPDPSTRIQEFVAPRDHWEEQLVAIVQDILKVENISVKANLFELGAHSVQMVKLHNRIGGELGRDIPIVELFRHTSISTMADFLRGNTEAETDELKESEDRARSRSSSRRGAARKRAARDLEED